MFRSGRAPADPRKEKGKAKMASFQKKLKRDPTKKKYKGGDARKQKKFSFEANTSKSYSGCFICQGPYWTRDCLKEQLNVLVTEEVI